MTIIIYTIHILREIFSTTLLEFVFHLVELSPQDARFLCVQERKIQGWNRKHTVEKKSFLFFFCHTCCFKTLSLKRSKSVSIFLRFFMAIFLAHEVFSHLVMMSSSVNLFRTCFALAEGDILILKSVSHSLLKFIAWRRTPVHGPSTRPCRLGRGGAKQLNGRSLWCSKYRTPHVFPGPH